MEALIMQKQLRWAGHAIQVPDDLRPRKIFRGNFETVLSCMPGSHIGNDLKVDFTQFLNKVSWAYESPEDLAHDRSGGAKSVMTLWIFLRLPALKPIWNSSHDG